MNIYKNKKKGFTLIEVIAVLVILSIIALIVTPLVAGIIRKAKISANKRSIDAYGRTVELATVAYMLDDTKEPTSFDDLVIEYRGEKVECAINKVNYDGSAFLDKCTVNGRFVKDSKSSSGYYQYGKDTGNYMFTKYIDIEESTSGNSSSSGSSTGGTTNNGGSANNGGTTNGNGTSGNNGSQASTPTTVTYNGGVYYQLSNISVPAGYVALIGEPLSYEDVVNYAGNIPVTNVNGIGMVAYYTSDTCNESNQSGCTTDYGSSNVKVIIDAWAAANLNGADARVMTTEYLTNLGYALVGDNVYQKTSKTPDTLFNVGVDYWAIDGNGHVYKGSARFSVTYPYDIAAIRPIIIAKSSEVKPNATSSASTPKVTADASNPYTVDMVIIFISILVIVVCTIIYVIYMFTNKNKDDDKNKKEKK